MNFITFRQLVGETKEYSNFDMYLSERGYQDWMDSYNTDSVVKILQSIWSIFKADNKLLALKNLTGKSYRQTYTELGIPARTYEDWVSERRVFPEYNLLLIVFAEIGNADII